MEHSSIYKKLDELFNQYDQVKPQELAPVAAKSDLTAAIGKSVVTNPFIKRHGLGKKPHKELGKKLSMNTVTKIKKYAEEVKKIDPANLSPDSQDFYRLFVSLNPKNPIAAINNIVSIITSVLMDRSNQLATDPDKNAELRIAQILKATGLQNYDQDIVLSIIEVFEDNDISKFLETAQAARNTGAQQAPQGKP